MLKIISNIQKIVITFLALVIFDASAMYKELKTATNNLTVLQQNGPVCGYHSVINANLWLKHKQGIIVDKKTFNEYILFNITTYKRMYPLFAYSSIILKKFRNGKGSDGNLSEEEMFYLLRDELNIPKLDCSILGNVVDGKMVFELNEILQTNHNLHDVIKSLRTKSGAFHAFIIGDMTQKLPIPGDNTKTGHYIAVGVENKNGTLTFDVMNSLKGYNMDSAIKALIKLIKT